MIAVYEGFDHRTYKKRLPDVAGFTKEKAIDLVKTQVWKPSDGETKFFLQQEHDGSVAYEIGNGHAVTVRLNHNNDPEFT